MNAELEPVFLPFTQSLDTFFLDGVPDVVANGLAWVRNPMRGAMALYVIIQATMMLRGVATASSVIGAVVRAVCVMAILEAPNYVQYVQQMALVTLPTELASAVNGARVVASAAEQFDVLRERLVNLGGLMMLQMAGDDGLFDRAAVMFTGLFGSFGIFVMWLFWYVPRVLTGIVICLGPFLLGFALFRATRGYVHAWVGKLVSLLVLHLATSIVVQLLVQAMTRRMIAALHKPGSSVDVMIWNFGGVALLMWFGAVILLILPTALTFGSNIGASANALVGYAAGAASTVARMPSRMPARPPSPPRQ